MVFRELRPVLSLVVICLCSNISSAQSPDLDWAERMFSDLKIDFGTVARGSETRTEIVLQNLYEEDVTLVDVKTTCGCTAAEPDKTLLKTYEKARISVEMDTVKFTQRKDSNVDVTLRFHGQQGTSTKTVRVPITAYIRPDVVLTPGQADFGTIASGENHQKTLKVAYAGRPNWQIRGVRVANEELKANVKEVDRGNGRVTYELTIDLLTDRDNGLIQDRIVLLTDDAKAPEVPVLVTGRITPDIEVIPGELEIGNLSVGEVRQYNLVVKGRKPFAIQSIECNGYPNCFEHRELSSELKNVHIVPLKITAPDHVGEFEEIFTVNITGRDDPITFTAAGTIMAGS